MKEPFMRIPLEEKEFKELSRRLQLEIPEIIKNR
jgi:hypothetical protein